MWVFWLCGAILLFLPPWPDNDILWRLSSALLCDQNLFSTSGYKFDQRSHRATSSRKFSVWKLLRISRPPGLGQAWALLVYFVADCLQLDIGWRWWQFGWQRTVNMSYHHNWYLGKYTPHSTTTTYQTFPGKNFRQHKQYHVLHRLKILPFSGCIATGDRGWYRRL